MLRACTVNVKSLIEQLSVSIQVKLLIDSAVAWPSLRLH